MKRERKNKRIKKAILIVCLVIAVIATILILVKVLNKNNDDSINIDGEQRELYTLPDTSYSGMEVSNVEMEYLKEDESTMVTMRITNTTNLKVENENFTAVLLNSNGDVLGSVPTSIETIEAGGVYEVSVVIRGDLTSATQVKLEKQS
mgnify:FL=1